MIKAKTKRKAISLSSLISFPFMGEWDCEIHLKRFERANKAKMMAIDFIAEADRERICGTKNKPSPLERMFKAIMRCRRTAMTPPMLVSITINVLIVDDFFFSRFFSCSTFAVSSMFLTFHI